MRCYNGCPDSELQSKIDRREEARKKVLELNPNACCTYHYPTGYYPEWGYQWHEHGKDIGKMDPNFFVACNSAIEKLS